MDERHHVTLGSHRMAYTVRGEGAPVLAIHSSGLSVRQFKRLEAELAPTHRVILPELFGYGRSSRPDPSEPFHFVLDLLALERVVDAIGEPVHLVGHSYGGFLALLLAIHRPRSLRSIAVYEPVSFGVLRSKGEREALATLEELGEDRPRPETPEAAEAWLEAFVDYWNGPGGWRGMNDAVKASFRDAMPKLADEVRSLGADRTPHGAYASVEVPALLLGSERSTLAADRVLSILEATLPSARRIRIAGASHMGPVTHPAEVNAQIVAHLRAAG